LTGAARGSRRRETNRELGRLQDPGGGVEPRGGRLQDLGGGGEPRGGAASGSRRREVNDKVVGFRIRRRKVNRELGRRRQLRGAMNPRSARGGASGFRRQKRKEVSPVHLAVSMHTIPVTNALGAFLHREAGDFILGFDFGYCVGGRSCKLGVNRDVQSLLGFVDAVMIVCKLAENWSD
jgi:hypothetical protein